MRAPAFLRTRVERLERAGAVRGIIASLSDPREKTDERAHAAKALADMAGRLGDARDEAVEILLIAADERGEVRKWALLDGPDLRRARLRRPRGARCARRGRPAPRRSRVRPLLERAALTDPYPWVRDAAKDALDVLEG